MPARAHGSSAAASVCVSDPLYKPGDLVRTPSGRYARVIEVRPERRRLVRYLDEAPGEDFEIGVTKLEMMKSAAVKPWSNRRPPEGA